MDRRILLVVATLLAAHFLGGCTPRIDTLTNTSGPERSVVQITGQNLLLGSVVWDAGLPSEQLVPGGFLGAYIFSVPPGASLGAHPVAVRWSTTTSNKLMYTVTAPNPATAPRIDRVSIVAASFSGGQVNTWLYVQGANIDVGAVVQVNGTDVASAAHRVLRNDLHGIAPTALAFPIYHYLSVIAAPGAMPVGSNLSITVRNLDSQVSGPVTYKLPMDAATMDSDGDNLPDTWEVNGYDADGDGVIDVDLKALGADPARPDLLVEVDVMQSLANPPIATTATVPGTFDTAKAMFAAAPIINPGNAQGVNLILDTSGTVPYTATLGFGTIIPTPMGATDFATLKAANFDNAKRGRIYHYAIWGNALSGGYSGVSDVDFGPNMSGDDFLISFDDFPASYQSRRSQVETFLHELGHDLGQRHGGDTHSQYKPNYLSVMSYTWQLRSGQTDAWRRGKPTCSPIYWADSAATEVNGAAPSTINAVTDYSEGMARDLVENTASLDEPTGVCGVAVYWNSDTDATDTGLSLDADDNGVATETLHDFGNWRTINFRGPELNGSLP